jgi:hypothetical protein
MLPGQRPRLLRANADELTAHQARLAKIASKAGKILWPDEGIK